MARLTWRPARLVKVRDETASARTLVFDVPGWSGHLPGQHVDVRLTADDGYTARRSYSLAGADGVELTVQRVDDGEVSPYLTEVMRPGDELEVRGPVGGWFVWRPANPAPVLLVAGGAGIVPLMAMVRARRAAGSGAPFRLVYSVRSPEQLYYADELAAPDPGVDVSVVYTRTAPDGEARPAGRLTAADLGPSGEADCYVCGPTGFVEAAAGLLLELGHDPARVRTERFGPTGE
ncbi:ferredoxin reductase [Nonomuraea pusilla]|uniref:ferredoxin reductase n=1 Tax=Nonomuraea pusilla TaxID=46177 RepID=UPI003318981D